MTGCTKLKLDVRADTDQIKHGRGSAGILLLMNDWFKHGSWLP